MGFFDNVKNSFTETSQDLNKKAKDTTEYFRLNNLNKTKRKKSRKLFIKSAWRSIQIKKTNVLRCSRNLWHK